MKKSPSSEGFRHVREKVGMALVVTLALIVLAVVAALAFFARATSNRIIEASRSSQVLVQQVAETGADYVVSQFLREIASNSTVTTNSGVVVYRPTTNTFAVPRRFVAPSLTNDTNFYNLIRQSVTNASADTNASPDNSATLAKNGRSVGVTRWNAPQLLTSGGFSSTNQLPNWIYLNRDGSVTNSASSSAIGRFAYNAYNEGALLDANVAGSPSVVTASDRVALAGTLAAADVSLIPGVNANAFVQWRNASSAGSAASYLTAVTNAATSGFLRTPSGDRSIASRQDLIKIARNGTLGITTNALPYLTHFSRKVNAPVFSYPASGTVSTNSTNASPLAVRMTAAGSTAWDGFTWRSGDSVVPRKFPLSRLAWLGFSGPANGATAEQIQSAFGLVWDNTAPNDTNPANLTGDRWIYAGHTGTTPVTEIKTLAQVATENREPNFFEILKAAIHRGSLGAGDTGTMSPGSDVLDNVDDLQILRLGACIIDQADADSYPTLINFRVSAGGSNITVETHGVENLPYIQRIAPFYINPSWPNDPGPAARTMQTYITPEFWNPHRQALNPSANSPQSLRVYFTGSHFLRIAFGRPGNYDSVFTTASGNLVIPATAFPSFFNPAPVTAAMGATASGVFQAMPFKKFPVASSDNSDAVIGARTPNAANLAAAAPTPINPPPVPPAPTDPEIAAAAETPPRWWNGYFWTSDSNRRAWVIDGWGSAPNRFNALVQFLNYRGRYQNYNVFSGGFYTDDAALNQTLLGIGGGVIVTGFRREEYPMPYIENGPENAWSTTNAGALTDSPTSAPPALQSIAPVQDLLTINRQGGRSLVKGDPRTARLGVARYDFNTRNGTTGVFTWTPGVSFAASLRPESISPMNTGPSGFLPESGSVGNNLTRSGSSYRPAMYEVNSGAAGEYYNDNDGIARPGDSLFLSQADSPRNAAAARPVILDRPFRSVGELGYVFRDLPFKSLDLFSNQSVDAALLDFFCVSESPLTVAGVVQLSRAPQAVIEALISGSARTLDAATVVSSGEATTIAAGLVTQFASAPPLSTADIVAGLYQGSTSAAFPGQKTRREAAIRALATVNNERTWNILIDVIAQVGKSGATGADFIVEGESRHWLHVALDRYSGELVAESREQVNE